MNYDFNPKSLMTALPAKDEWTFTTYPYGITWDGEPMEWAFCLSEYFIINEQFTNGTQECLTHWFKTLNQKSPNHDSILKMKMSTKPNAKAQTKWILHPTMNTKKHLKNYPAKTSYYQDAETGQTLWLCPMWSDCWGGTPSEIFIEFT